jgi:quercetin dioxygenase-like cupin family protein
MRHDEFYAIDTEAQPWEQRRNEKLGRAIFRKDLYNDPETGVEIRLVRYPAGLVNPAHTHPCGHGLYVVEGELVTHKGTFGPGSFVWFPEGEVMEHGASWAGDCALAGICCTLHQLRHTHATELINGGVSLATIRKRLGHKHLQTTLRYAEQSDAMADAEVRARRRK